MRGTVRFSAIRALFGVGHCHCHSCRKHNGAVVATFVGFTPDQVTLMGQPRKIHASSPGVGCGFCENCGTPIIWEGAIEGRGEVIEFHICSFDRPDALAPTDHAHDATRIAWFEIADNLPRYKASAGTSPLLRHGPTIRNRPEA